MSFEVKLKLSADSGTEASSMNIIGCDYSAAKAQPNATWLASGNLLSEGLASSQLNIDRLEKIGSDKLLEYLLSLTGAGSTGDSPRGNCPRGAAPGDFAPAPQTNGAWLIGLDFPFSLPRPFIEILLKTNRVLNAGSSANFIASNAAVPWVEVAEQISQLTYNELVSLVQAAKPIMGGEVKRQTDNSTDPKAQSPLHQINPGMLKMTWQGMQLLLALHHQDFAILPFSKGIGLNRSLAADVIEVYPAAILKALGLPWRKYKGKDQEAKQLRQFILSNLLDPSDKLRTVNRINSGQVKLELAPHLEQIALDSDDALDAVIAAVGAANAYLNPSQTAPPSHILPHTIALEGWIYVPYPKTVQATT
jgi:predicted nuclease with RNAse H fold